MSQLTSLPIELLLSMAEFLPSEKDLAAFLQTNKTTYAVLQNYLYKNNIYYRGTSALLWAAKHGHASLATKLLEAGASIGELPIPEYYHNPGNIRDVAPGDPLALAAEGNHIETLQVLLTEKRPDQACRPVQLRGALRRAFNSRSREAVELLVQHGALLDSVDGRFPEDHSALGEAVISCFPSIIPVLLKAGAKPGDKGDADSP